MTNDNILMTAKTNNKGHCGKVEFFSFRIFMIQTLMTLKV